MDDKTMPSESKLNQYFLWRFCRMTFHFIRSIVFIFLIATLLIGVGFLYLKSKPLPAPDLPSATKIYDDKGNLIDQIDQGKYREPIKLTEVPKHLIDATLSAEDETFYSHFGLSMKGILRAAWINFKSREIKQGASTITQQLARNLYLTHDRTWSRKLKEAILAIQLELHYSKDEILEMYLNHIYYGSGAYGVKRASRVYFGKEVQDLQLAESAFLAGLPRGPSFYSPYRHFERAKRRQQHILKLMVEDRKITQKQATKAQQTLITIVPPSKPTKMNANYFRDYVIRTAIKKYNLDESLVYHGGLKIYTTLNKQLQQAAEQSVNQYLRDKNDLQSALISVDPKTGHIKAMVGGKDYKQSEFNRVFAKRQPGSSFKPILYLSALEHGFTPTTTIISQPTSFFYHGELYQPRNFRNQYAYRPITLREAIARSDNIYAVSTQLQVGLQPVIDMAHRLGITSPLRATPSLALGSYAVTPFEMTQAYSTIASGGIRRDLIGIVKIVDDYGNVIVDQKPQEGKQVALTTHTFILSRLLSGVFQTGGTANRVGMIFDHPASGKTGSTHWDGWLSGYTPDLVTTVWVGYDQGRRLAHHEARLSQYIWAQYMKQALKNTKKKTFPVPKGVKSVHIDPETGYLATPLCKHTKLEYFVRGTEPTTSCPLHAPSPLHPTKDQDSWWRQVWKWWKNT